MTACAFILLGGLFSWDGVVTSAGMEMLASRLRALPGVSVETYLWQLRQMPTCKKDKVALIGYSGGAAHVTWVAKGYNGGPTNWSSSFGERPHIDLLVAYDPSPRGATFTLDDNVGKAIVYQNSSPMMFGLGGATISGPQVEVVEIAQNHLLVQTNTKLHDRTVEEVRKLTEAPNDSSIKGIQRK